MTRNKRVVWSAAVMLGLLFVIGPWTPTHGQPAPKTLKIGVITNMGWSLGVDFKMWTELIADTYNKNGGLPIGGEKYKLEILALDSKMSHEVSRAAAERLVYQDKVKFIVGDETVDAWVPVTEANKVVAVAVSPAPAIMNPKYRYTFQGSTLNTDAPQTWGWFAKNNPNIKTILCAFPDNKLGRIRGALAKRLSETFGPKMLEPIFYPAEATDLSVVGTRVRTLNPDAFSATAGGTAGDALCFKSAWQAGYKGQLFSFVAVSVGSLAAVVPVESLEGMIAGENAIELENPPPVAKEFREIYVAKNGKWDNRNVLFINTFWILLDALQKAKSVDPEKIAETTGSGLRYEGLQGQGMMVARPDLGNTRTVDTIVPVYMKRVEKGKPKVIGHLGMDEAFDFNKTYYKWK